MLLIGGSKLLEDLVRSHPQYRRFNRFLTARIEFSLRYPYLRVAVFGDSVPFRAICYNQLIRVACHMSHACIGVTVLQNQPLVSVLAPVCSVEKCLDECLSPLQNQTLKDIEIICINEGSTDSSLETINRFASEDPPDSLLLISQIPGAATL